MSQRDDMERLRRVYDEWARGEFWSVDIYDPEIVFTSGVCAMERRYGWEAAGLSRRGENVR